MCSAYVLVDAGAELVVDTDVVGCTVWETVTVVVTLTTPMSVEVAKAEPEVVVTAEDDTGIDEEAESVVDDAAVLVDDTVAGVEELAVPFPKAFALNVVKLSPGLIANTMPCWQWFA